MAGTGRAGLRRRAETWTNGKPSWECLQGTGGEDDSSVTVPSCEGVRACAGEERTRRSHGDVERTVLLPHGVG